MPMAEPQAFVVGAFVLPLAALVVATILEFAVPALQVPAVDALLRIAWDGTVTALGLTGAIGSDVLGRGDVVGVEQLLGLSPVTLQTLAIFWVLFCLALLISLRARSNRRWYIGVIGIMIA